MYQKPAMPRSIGGVLDDSLQLYKASFASCWLPSLLVSIVTLAVSYYIVAAIPLTLTPVPPAEMMGRYGGLVRQFGIWYVLLTIITLVFYGMLVVNIAAVSRGETPAFGASIAKAARRAPALFVAGVVFAISIGIGFILLLIPGFYLWNRLQLFVVPLIDEGQGPFSSLGASWTAVGGHWWRTATIVTVMIIILIVLQLVLSALAGVIAALGGAGSGLAGNPLALIGRVQIVSLLVSGFVRIFTLPLIFAVFVAVYQDLILRKGGGDLEARLGALPKG